MNPDNSHSGAEQPPRRLAYSVSEVVEIVGVGRSYLYGEIKDGRLRIRKAGRRSLIYEADLRAWLASLPEKRSA